MDNGSKILIGVIGIGAAATAGVLIYKATRPKAGGTATVGNGGVTHVTVPPGTKYDSTKPPPTVTIAPPPSGGTPAKGIATVNSDGTVTVTITDPGTGYTTPPTVTLNGGTPITITPPPPATKHQVMIQVMLPDGNPVQGAAVTIDGHNIGTTAANGWAPSYMIASGSYLLTASKGGITAQGTISVPDYDSNFQINLSSAQDIPSTPHVSINSIDITRQANGGNAAVGSVNITYSGPAVPLYFSMALGANGFLGWTTEPTISPVTVAMQMIASPSSSPGHVGSPLITIQIPFNAPARNYDVYTWVTDAAGNKLAGRIDYGMVNVTAQTDNSSYRQALADQISNDYGYNVSQIFLNNTTDSMTEQQLIDVYYATVYAYLNP
jgi:hypothetical protein